MEGEWVSQKKSEGYKAQQNASADPNNTAWKNDKSTFGFQMLLKMGWKEGQGLGKNEQGDIQTLNTFKQFDTAGLGQQKANSSDNWLETKTSYEDILARLNAHYSNPNVEPGNVCEEEEKETKAKSRKRSRSSSQMEEKKKKRKKDTISDPDEKLETKKEESTGDEVLKSRRVLYPKRTASKLVSLFSESDLNQILANTEKSTPKRTEETIDDTADISSDSEGKGKKAECSEEETSKKHEEKRKKRKQKGKEKKIRKEKK